MTYFELMVAHSIRQTHTLFPNLLSPTVSLKSWNSWVVTHAFNPVVLNLPNAATL